MTNDVLAALALERTGRYLPRSPERRAAAALYAALADTRSPDGARRALAFTSQPVRADALALLRILERQAREAGAVGGGSEQA